MITLQDRGAPKEVFITSPAPGKTERPPHPKALQDRRHSRPEPKECAPSTSAPPPSPKHRTPAEKKEIPSEPMEKEQPAPQRKKSYRDCLIPAPSTSTTRTQDHMDRRRIRSTSRHTNPHLEEYPPLPHPARSQGLCPPPS